MPKYMYTNDGDPEPDHSRPDSYSLETEAFVATLAQIAATRGDAPAVAVLEEADADITSVEQYRDFGEWWWRFRLRLSRKRGSVCCPGPRPRRAALPRVPASNAPEARLRTRPRNCVETLSC
jgi:hypothetical protein